MTDQAAMVLLVISFDSFFPEKIHHHRQHFIDHRVLDLTGLHRDQPVASTGKKAGLCLAVFSHPHRKLCLIPVVPRRLILSVHPLDWKPFHRLQIHTADALQTVSHRVFLNLQLSLIRQMLQSTAAAGSRHRADWRHTLW